MRQARQPLRAGSRRSVLFAGLPCALLALAVAREGIAQVIAPPRPASSPQDLAEARLRARQLNLMAGEMVRARRFPEAIRYAREGLALSELVYGPVHPNIAADLITLATLYRAVGDLFNAEPLIERAIDVDRKLHGDRHPEVGVDTMVHAQLLRQRGDRGAAERALRHAISLLGAAGVADRYAPPLAQARFELGMLLVEAGRIEEALPEFQASVPVLERSEPAAAHQGLLQMAEIERKRGRLAQAQALIDRAAQLRPR